MPVVIIPLLRLAGRRPADVPAARPPAGRHHLRPDQLAQRPDRRLGDPARRHPRPDDVLRPRRPGQQGGLRLRHRRPERRRPRVACGSWPRSWPPAWCRRWRWRWPPRCGPSLFSEPERENGRAAWLLGASFISEGAIPFAAADPLRVIPSMMVGGAVTGALIMAFDVTLKAPHGGIFVFFAIGNLMWFLVGAGRRYRRRRAGGRSPPSSSSSPKADAQAERRTRRRLSTSHTDRPPPRRSSPCPARPSSSARRSDCTPGPPRSSPRPSSTPACR